MKLSNYITYIGICLFVLAPAILLGQPSEIPLFSSDDPLDITIILDLKTVRNDKSDDPQYSGANLILYENGDSINFNIKVKARGHSRRMFDFCSFPPLKLNFKKNEVKETVFNNQDKLKLVTYCKDLDNNEFNVLKEYLIYKTYNYLTPYSFKVRLANITYKNISEKGKQVKRIGFFIEDEEMMAQRNGTVITERLMSNHDRCERNTLDLFTVFQFMIGNTDWWIAKPKVHNVKTIQSPNGEIRPVPYDFDYCGAVGSRYATPHDGLPIQSVKERYFRGYCRIPGTYENVAEKFNAAKKDIYEYYQNFELLPKSQTTAMLRFYDGFYKIIDNPRQIKSYLYNVCELHHKHLHKQKKVNKQL